MTWVFIYSGKGASFAYYYPLSFNCDQNIGHNYRFDARDCSTRIFKINRCLSVVRKMQSNKLYYYYTRVRVVFVLIELHIYVELGAFVRYFFVFFFFLYLLFIEIVIHHSVRPVNLAAHDRGELGRHDSRFAIKMMSCTQDCHTIIVVLFYRSCFIQSYSVSHHAIRNRTIHELLLTDTHTSIQLYVYVYIYIGFVYGRFQNSTQNAIICCVCLCLPLYGCGIRRNC